MADINFFAGFSLGKIQKWSDTKAAAMTPVSFPGKDSNLTEAIDTLGVIAYINFSGRWVGSFETIQSLIYNFKSLADGAQYASQPLRSPFVVSVFGPSASTVRVQGGISTNTTATTNKLIDSTANFSTFNQTTSDIVKNLITGDTATISSIDSDTQLTLSSDIFPTSGGTGVSYAVTATINCKILSIETNWELPGLSYCDYKMSAIQVK